MCAQLPQSGGATGGPLLHASILNSTLAILMLSWDRAALAAPGVVTEYRDTPDWHCGGLVLQTSSRV